MSAKLSVNLNAVAFLRNRRDLPWPDLENLGRLALAAGASGLTVHPRPDQRHIRDSDLPVLRALIDDEFPAAEFNIEGYPTRRFIELVLENQPEQTTLVPDDPGQATSDHGWDMVQFGAMLKPIIAELKNSGTRVALFCDPDADVHALQIAADIGADCVELYTEPYAQCMDDSQAAHEHAAILGKTALTAKSLGLGVNAGHDLTVANLPLLVKNIPHLAEVSIGHGLTADALEYGMGNAVERFLVALDR